MVRFNFKWALFLAVFALSSAYFFIFGKSGILERILLEKQKAGIEAKINALRDENGILKNRLDQYRQGAYTGDDYLESGYMKPGDKVLFFSAPGEKPAAAKKAKEGSEEYEGLLPTLRIIWICISVALIASLFLYYRKLKNQVSS